MDDPLTLFVAVFYHEVISFKRDLITVIKFHELEERGQEWGRHSCTLTSVSQKHCDSLTSSPPLVVRRRERVIIHNLKYSTAIALCYQPFLCMVTSGSNYTKKKKKSIEQNPGAAFLCDTAFPEFQHGPGILCEFFSVIGKQGRVLNNVFYTDLLSLLSARRQGKAKKRKERKSYSSLSSPSCICYRSSFFPLQLFSLLPYVSPIITKNLFLPKHITWYNLVH